jgi:hypothetical protein
VVPSLVKIEEAEQTFPRENPLSRLIPPHYSWASVSAPDLDRECIRFLAVPSVPVASTSWPTRPSTLRQGIQPGEQLAMVNPQFDGIRPTMFICGNDTGAKATVTRILDQFGWETEDMGKSQRPAPSKHSACSGPSAITCARNGIMRSSC